MFQVITDNSLQYLTYINPPDTLLAGKRNGWFIILIRSSFSKFASNSGRAVFVNVIRLATSFILTLWLPKIMHLDGYSRWQLYLFLTSYLVFSSFGICEGLYLEHGGIAYADLDKSAISGQIWLLSVFQGTLCLLSWIIVPLLFGIGASSIVIMLAVASAALDIPRFALQCVLQASGRIKSYARIQGLERLLFFAFACICLSLGKIDYFFVAGAEIASRFISLAVSIIICRDIVSVRPPRLSVVLNHSKKLIKTGFMLMSASFFSQISIGAARLVVLWKWGEIKFGGLSFALSLANVTLTCATGVGIALFPILRRVEKKDTILLYPIARTGVLLLSLAAMALYPILKAFLAFFMPDFSANLVYLTVLFPLCIFEVRTIILTDTYFKALNKPDLIFITNALSALLSITSAVIVATITDSIIFVAATTLLSSIIKSFSSEVLIKKITGYFSIRDICSEYFFVGIFLFSSFTLDIRIAAICNIAAIILLLLLNVKSIRNFIVYIKHFAKET